MRATRNRSHRELAITSTLAIAAALVAGVGTAQAQSFQGTGSIVAGNASIVAGGSTTTITLQSPTAVINWSTNDSAIANGVPIAFQAANTTATFRNAVGAVSDFAVLNRILPTDPTRPIQFDGHVVSQLQAAAGGPVTSGGTVLFYSPAGILIGANAVFDVGNLGLTASDVVFDPTSGDFLPGGTATFLPANAGSVVQIAGAAHINATNAGSYVAVVAPSITQSGSINVNGSAALVAADAATITFSPDGLFNIQATSGTSAANQVLTSNGSITGAAGNSGTGANHRIYMVAVPKNQAITMLIANGSTLGFDVAAAADVVGNAIVLSGGLDIAGGDAVTTGPSIGAGTGQAGIFIQGVTATSALTASATGFDLLGVSGGTIANFSSNLTLQGATSPGNGATAYISLNGTGSGVNINGNLTLTTLDQNVVAPLSVIQAPTLSTIDVANAAVLNVAGATTVAYNVSNLVQGAAATGGSARIFVSSGATAQFGGAVSVFANTFTASAAAGTSGDATGGIAAIATSDAAITIGGATTVTADAFSGNSQFSGDAGSGNATGGTVNLTTFGNSSSIQFNGTVNTSASGTAGQASGAGTVGTATGGDAVVTANGGTNSGISFSSTLQALAQGTGGAGTSGISGTATGGNATLNAFGTSTVSVTGGTTLDSSAMGAAAFGSSGSAGAAVAGHTNVNANSGGVIQLSGTTQLTSNAFGGAIDATNTAGGSATAGVVAVTSSGSTSNIVINNGINASANAVGGGGSGCLACTSDGGAALGGTVTLFSTGSGGAISVAGATALAASAVGGNASSTNGAIATGGSVQGIADTDSALTFGGQVTVVATGEGGDQTGNLAGGLGTGGFVQFVSHLGGSLQVNAGITASSQGLGGTGFGTGASGGGGTGGTARLFSDGGTIGTTSDVSLNANGLGGVGDLASGAGNGGAGIGGTAELRVNSPTLNGNNGLIAIGGTTTLLSDATGGAGAIAGSGTGGQSILFTRFGRIQSAQALLSSKGVGGQGVSGSDGGTGTGGTVDIFSLNSLAGAGSITIGNTSAVAEGVGGIGGDGATPGQNGGNGGLGTGGIIAVAASAGNGTLSITNLSADARGIGQRGGNGGASSTGQAGKGGIGGAAAGGNIQIGTISDIDTGAVNTGSGSYTTIFAFSDATGGAGGAGGSGAGGGIDGNGGDGGLATAGAATLLVRGAPVTLTGASTFSGSAQGGSGGSGGTSGVAGVGGNAIADGNSGAGLLATNRFNVPSQRGSLSASNLTFTSSIVGGAGSTAGVGTLTAQQLFLTLTNADVSATSIGFAGSANVIGATALASPIAVTGGNLNLTGNLSFVTPGDVSLTLDSGNINLDTAVINGRNFVLGSAPVTTGTLHAASSLQLFTNSDIVAYANIDTPFSQGFTVPGRLQLGNVTSGGSVTAQAIGGDITLGAINATGVNLTAGNFIAVGPIAAPTDVVMAANAGITTGPILAGGKIDLTAGTLLTANGSLDAGDKVSLKSLGGAVTIGNASAGIVNPSSDPAAKYNISIQSAGSITAGTLNALHDIGLVTPGNVDVFSLTGRDIGVLATGSSTVGSLNPNGRVLFADSSMAALGFTSSGFDPNPIFAAAPVRGTGAIFINNPVSGGTSFAAATSGAFTVALAGISVGDITGTGPISIDAGSVTAGNLSGTSVTVHGDTALSVGNVNSNGAASLSSGGALLSGYILANGQVDVSAAATLTATAVVSLGGPITVASGSDMNLSGLSAPQAITATSGGTLTVTGGLDPVFGNLQVGANGAITLTATGNILLPNVQADPTQFGLPPSFNPITITSSQGSVTAGLIQTLGDVVLAAKTTLTAASMTGRDLLGLGSGAISFGAINNTGRVLLADYGMLASGQAAGVFDPNAVFAATPVRTTGPIAIAGAINASQFSAASGGTFMSQAITSSGTLAIDSGAAVNTGALSGATGVNVTATGDVLTLGISSGEVLKVTSAGAITTGALQAGDTVEISGTGAVNVANVSAGIVNPSVTPGAQYSIGLRSLASVTAGSLTARAGAGVSTPGAIAVGAVQAGNLFIALGGGNITTGAIRTGPITAPSGQVYIADFSMEALGGQLTQNFNPAPILAAVPVRTGGSLTINGPVSTGFFQAATLGTITTTSIAGRIMMNSGGSISGTVYTGVSVNLVSDNLINLGQASGNAAVVLTSKFGVTTGNLTSSNGVMFVTAGQGAVSTGNLFARNLMVMGANTSLSTGTITSGDLIVGDHGNAALGNISSTSRVLIADQSMIGLGVISPTQFDPNLVFAATPIESAGTISTGSITAAQDVQVAGGLGVTLNGLVQAGDDVTIRSSGNIQAGDITSGILNPTTGTGASHTIALLGSGGTIATGNLQALDNIGLVGPQTITTGTLSGRDMLILGGGNVALGAVNATARVLVADYSMAPLGGAFNSNYDPNLVFAATPVRSGGSLTVNGPVVVGNNFDVATAGNITTGAVTSNGVIRFDTGGAVLGTNYSGVAVLVSSDGSISLGTVNGPGAVVLSGAQGLTVGNVSSAAGFMFLVSSQSSVTTGNVFAKMFVATAAAQSLTTGTISGGDLLITAHGNSAVGDLSSTGRILLSDASALAAGSVPGGGTNGIGFDPNLVFQATPIESAGTITAGNITSAGDVQIAGGAGVTINGLVQAGDDVNVRSSGNIRTADITSGILNPTTGVNASHTIALLDSGGTITAGNLKALDDIGLVGPQTITTGTLAGRDMLILGGGDMAFGAINATSRVLIADYSMAPLGGSFNGNYDPNLVFAATPVRSAGSLTLNGPVVTGDFFKAATTGNITTGTITANSLLSLDTGGSVLGTNYSGFVVDVRSDQSTALGNVNSPVAIVLLGTQGLTTGDITASQGFAFLVSGQGSVSAGNVFAKTFLVTGAGQSLSTGTISGGDLLITAHGNSKVGDITSTGRVLLADTSMLSLGAVPANGTTGANFDPNLVLQANPVESAGTITAGKITAPGNVQIAGGAGVTLTGLLQAGDNVNVRSSGNIKTTDITAGIVNPTTGANAKHSIVLLDSGGTIATGNLQALDDIGLVGPQTITTGTLAGRDMLILGGGNIALGAITATARVLLADYSMAPLGGSFNGNYDPNLVFAATPVRTAGAIGLSGPVNVQSFSAATAQSFTSGAITSASLLSIDSGGALATGNLSAATLSLNGGLTIAVGQVSSSVSGMMRATGAITTAGILGTGDFLVATGTDLLLGDITQQGALTLSGAKVTTGTLSTGGNLSVSATGDLSSTGATSQGTLALTATGALSTGAVQAASNITLRSGNGATLTAGAISSGNGTIAVSGGGAVNLQKLTANGNITASSGTSLTVGSVGNVAGSIVLSTSGDLTTANVSSVQGPINLQAGGAISAAAINGGGPVSIFSSSSITAGNVTSGQYVLGEARNNAVFGNISANGTNGSVQFSADTGSLVTGNVNAVANVALFGGTSVSLGNVRGRDLLLLGGTNVNTGNLLAGIVIDPATNQVTNATGRILIGNSSSGPLGGKFLTYNYNAVFGAPVRVAGSVTTGPVVLAGRFTSYSQGAMTGNRISAFGSVEVESGALVTVAQQWSAPAITIRSNDIDIRPAGVSQTGLATLAGLNAGKMGTIALISLNPTQALIGDGLTGTGYALSQAEWSLINSGSLTIGAIDNPEQAIDLQIGTLAITGPQSGSTIDNPNGSVVFATGNPSTLQAGGGIRIVGNVSAKGFLPTNTLEFDTGTFELDASTGSLSITDTSGALAGLISISASHIHVASGTILDKLATDPFYVGHAADLNAPAAVQRPDGVLNALGIELNPDSTLYIQNTGTAAIPAGFLTTLDASDISTPATNNPTQGGQTQPALSVIINGQIVTPTGTVTGTSVFDLVKADPTIDLTGVTSDSTLNGCSFNTGCMSAASVVPDLASQVTTLSTNSLADAPVFVDTPSQTDDPAASDDKTEEEKKAASAAAAEEGPIAPPAPLIDTRPLNPPVKVEEPVAGSGNPALIGAFEPATQGELQ
ncbi:hypothetical protein [Novosphingobium lentum]|uniref:hypothetical protein n=1 Tax=Novosphingobium lentum TaxID=145287 RepID=UPI00082E356B|nr:hypothetical protein [Novosphingobium lentum]